MMDDDGGDGDGVANETEVEGPFVDKRASFDVNVAVVAVVVGVTVSATDKVVVLTATIGVTLVGLALFGIVVIVVEDGVGVDVTFEGDDRGCAPNAALLTACRGIFFGLFPRGIE
jgi:hypothetical protein